MLQFPRFRFTPQRPQKTSQTGFIYRFRSALALGLAALLFCAPLGFGVSARSLNGKSPTTPAAKKPEPAIVHNHPGGAQAHSNESKDFFSGYIIEMIDGTTACRRATRQEVQWMRYADPNQTLYPVKRRVERPREYDFQSHASKPAVQSSPTGLKINFRESQQLKDHPDRAKVIAAFQRAAAVWESRIKNPISIIIDIDYGKTRFGEPFCPAGTSCQTLGSTEDGTLPGRSFSGVRSLLKTSASSSAETTLYDALPAGTTVPTDVGPSDTVIVSRAIARALGLPGFAPDATDASEPFGTAPSIGFNENFSFDFNPDDIGVNDSNNDGIENGKTDFDAVAVHEIGHALGFTSFVGLKELVPELPNVLTMWDLFRFAPGVNLSSFPTANRWLTTGGNPVFFNNMGAGLQVSTGNPAGLGGDGEQSSHWKDNLNIGIMDPTIQNGMRQEITQNDLNALESFGYNLSNSVPPPPPPGAPANDNFANAQTLVGCTGSVNGTNVSATPESLEPIHDPGGRASGKSVWYYWQTPVGGSVTFNTTGSGTDFDTMLAVYTGNSVNSLSLPPVASNDDIQNGVIRTSSVTFEAIANTTYRIAVDGWDGDVGNFVLNWTQSSGCAPPPPTKTTPTITWNNPASITYGTALSSTQLNATANVPGSFVYLPAAGYKLNAGQQSISVTFTPTDTTNYNNASKTVPITVLKANQAITFNALSNKTFGDTFFNASAASSSGLPVSLSIVSGPATLSGNTITVTGTGTVVVRATQAGNHNYNAAPVVDRSFVVSKANQSISFGPLVSKTFGNAPFAVSATSSSGLPVSLQIVSGPATISGNTVTINGVGTVTVRATQAGNTNYNAATLVDQSFNVVSAGANVTLANLSHTYDGSAKFATATTIPAGKNVAFSYSRNGVPVASPINAGAYTVQATITDPGFQGTATGTLVINKANPVVTWIAPASILFGTALGNAQLSATANVPGSFRYNAQAGTRLNIGTYQLSTVFTPTDAVNYNTTAASAQLIVTFNPYAPNNAIDANDFFVRQHYLDFLDREPEAEGFQYWLNILNGCGHEEECLNRVRVEISSRFFIELEFQRTGFFVMRMYQASYGHPPTYSQFVADRRQVQNSPESQKLFATKWVQRSDFLAMYPTNLSNAEFVKKLYDQASVPELALRAAARQALDNNTKTRADVVYDLVEQAGFQAREYNPAFVRMQYFGYLRREVEAGGFTYWMNVLTNLSPNNYRSMICGFVNASEYQLRFNSTRGRYDELDCIW
jgi:MBG domain